MVGFIHGCRGASHKRRIVLPLAQRRFGSALIIYIYVRRCQVYELMELLK